MANLQAFSQDSDVTTVSDTDIQHGNAVAQALDATAQTIAAIAKPVQRLITATYQTIDLASVTPNRVMMLCDFNENTHRILITYMAAPTNGNAIYSQGVLIGTPSQLRANSSLATAENFLPNGALLMPNNTIELHTNDSVWMLPYGAWPTGGAISVVLELTA